MKSLIIIPAYNEEACIEQTVRDILEHAPNFDYIVINDCSKDRTKEICEKNPIPSILIFLSILELVVPYKPVINMPAIMDMITLYR